MRRPTYTWKNTLDRLGLMLKRVVMRKPKSVVRPDSDAFEVGDGFDDGDHQAQITRSGLATGEDDAAFFVDGDFHGVDFVITTDHQFGQRCIAFFDGAQGVGHLLFDQAAHDQHPVADIFQFGIELL